MSTDTIAAVATAMSDSGIGIVRVSGEQSIAIVDKIYRNKKGEKCLSGYASHTIHYGFIVDEKESVIDEVMVSVMKAPRSYTAEDTVEINCHGGVLIVQKILSMTLAAGARTAEPGEFTKRAFLNGRIDLSRAEAVMDLIHAKNEFALQSSVKQLKGEVFEKIKGLRESILYEIAFIESALDDPEHISLDGYQDKLEEKADEILRELNRLLATADDGRMLKEGIRTVIVGKPNAGKSSLLNLLVGEEKAIVTDIAGTTRDTLEETINLSGISLNLIDTAGIRNTEDVVEKIGVERAKKISQDADLILYVVDTSVPLDESDEEIFSLIEKKPAIILMNKSDLKEVVDKNAIHDKIKKESNDFQEEQVRFVKASMKKDEGIDELTELIKELFFHGNIQYNDEVYITNIRHKEALEDARKSILEVKKSLEMEMPEDFYSIDLMSAYASLGTIIGEEVGEDLVNEIFSKFCMGK
jgi:tRNA modification GTPase